MDSEHVKATADKAEPASSPEDAEKELINRLYGADPKEKKAAATDRPESDQSQGPPPVERQ